MQGNCLELEKKGKGLALLPGAGTRTLIRECCVAGTSELGGKTRGSLCGWKEDALLICITPVLVHPGCSFHFAATLRTRLTMPPTGRT